MYHKQLLKHIQNKKALGVSDEAIRAGLIQDGWTTKDIDLGFYYFHFPEKVKHFSLIRLLRSEVAASVFVIALILSCGVAAAAIIYTGQKIDTYTIVVPGTSSNKETLNYGIQPALSNPDFFNSIKNEFITEKATFVEVDLSQMIARVYKEGAVTLEVPVKTKGKPGSWWETPAGLYKIETKEKTHYSSMGHVTQPWSMQFQGNFFIHGWPKYDDGTPVASTFSGGCVRLADEDAKKIFDAVTVGTPILVYEKSFSPDAFSYTDNKPNIQAQSFLYADINNNFVFLKGDETRVVPAGDITKLMTALIATEYINIEKIVTVNESSLVETKKPRLTAGMKIDIYQLLFPLLRESSNEAGEVIASSYGRSLFIRHMNEKARAIGMTDTTFVDPTGMSADNTTTAEDVFMLAKYIYNNRSFIFNITSGKVKTNTYGTSMFTDLDTNPFAQYSTFFGGVDGYDTNLSLFEMPIGDVTRPVFFVSLVSKNAEADVRGGLEYFSGRYR